MDSGFYCMDCMDGMKQIADKSINLIHTDPPYNIGIAEWDKIPNYIEWCGKWLKECERVLKDNGSFYFWHNDLPQIAQLMEWIRQNTAFVFNSFIIWDKGEWRAQSWKNLMHDNPLRSWFNTCEYCLCYTLQDGSGISKILKSNIFESLQNYIKSEREKLGWNYSQIDKYLNIKASSCFWEKPTSHDYRIPNYKNYQTLQATGYYKREYEDLRREYEDLRFTHNLDKHHNNIWRTNPPTDKIHICEKPQTLINRIIRCSSNESDIVLDPFAGSASTAISCHKLNRKYICYEKDPDYYALATARLEAVKAQMTFFD